MEDLESQWNNLKTEREKNQEEEGEGILSYFVGFGNYFLIYSGMCLVL